MRRVRWSVAAAGAAALVLAGSPAGVAHAAEPPGSGVEIVSAHTSGNGLYWSGSYSCPDGAADTVTVQGWDELGHSATAVLLAACLGAATGVPVGGVLAAGLPGTGAAWGDDVTLTATVRGLLGTPAAADRVALSGGHLDEASLDGAALSGSALTLSGGFECDSTAGTGTIQVSATDPATGAPLDSTTQTVSCAGHRDAAGSWTTALAPGPAVGSDVHIEVDFTANEDSKTAMLDVTATP